MIFSERAQRIPPFHVMSILAHAKALEARGRSVIHLEVGEPDFPTPKTIIESGQRALEAGATFYTPALGLPELREAVARWYADRFGVQIDPERVVVTPGASGALLLAIAALIDPGEHVLLSDPGYPCNRNFVASFGGIAKPCPVHAASGYQLTPDDLKANAGSKAVMVATPGNPSGTITPLSELRTLAETARQLQQVLIVDEIYQGLTYDVPPQTAAALGEDVWIVNSFSKFFQMTGWRLGWLLAPRAAVPILDRLMQNLFLAASTVAQRAALAAFDPSTLEILEERRQELDLRRRFLLPELARLGFDVHKEPRGAFYVYADAGRLTEDTRAWCESLLSETGVALTPGIDFGLHASGRHVRFAYTRPIDQLEQALDRMRKFI